MNTWGTTINPYRDVSVRIELGERVQKALMTPGDWEELIDRQSWLLPIVINNYLQALT